LGLLSQSKVRQAGWGESDRSGTDRHVKNIVACFNSDNTHWITMVLSVETKVVAVWDSWASQQSQTRVRGKISEILKKFGSVLPEDMQHPRIEFPKCARQEDGYNYGAFALVFLCFLTSEIPMPANVDGTLWRRCFLAMANGSTLLSSLPADVKDVVHSARSTSFAETPETEPERTGETDPLAWIEYHGRRAQHIAKNAASQYRERESNARSVMEWVRSQVAPVMSNLMTSATQEVKRLGQVLKRIDANMEKCQQILLDLGEPDLALMTPMIETLKTTLDRLSRSQESQKKRLYVAKG
jgi:hypothetical protein